MEDNTSKSESVPTNGDVLHHPLNQTTEQVLNGKVPRPNLEKSLSEVPAGAKAKLNNIDVSVYRKKVNLSRTRPSQLFYKFFGSKSLTQGQLITRAFDAPAKAIPQQVVGLLQQRVKGATTRIAFRKNKIQEYRVILKTGVTIKNGRTIALTPSGRKSFLDKKLQAEAELIKAKDDKLMLRAYLDEALKANGSPMRDDIKSVREISFIKRMTPSISQRIIDQILAKPDLKESFLKVKSGEGNFLDVLKSNDAKTHKTLLSKPKLATQVKQGVLEQITATAK
jgi:hypothetical protein